MAISNEQVLTLIKKNPIATVCVMVILAVFGGMYYRSGDADTAASQLEEKSREGRRMENNIKYSAQLKEQLAKVEAANQQIEHRLVRVSDLASNLQYFYKLEADTGTKLVDLRQIGIPKLERGQRKGPKTAFDPVNYSVAVQGTYPQLVSFLQRVENGEHFSRVQSASFMPAAGAVGGDGGNRPMSRPDMLTLTLSLDLLGQP